MLLTHSLMGLGVLMMDGLVVYEMHRRTRARLNQSIGQIYQTFRARGGATFPVWLNAAAITSIVLTVMYVYWDIANGPV